MTPLTGEQPQNDQRSWDATQSLEVQAPLVVSLRRRPPFLGRLDERRWVIVGGVVMGSVHKLGYGHKFEGSAATSVVA